MAPPRIFAAAAGFALKKKKSPVVLCKKGVF